MSEEKSVTINLGFTGAFIYLACGMAYHLITSDAAFAWSNPWLYIDMALWPFWLLGWVIALIVIIVIIVAGIFGGAYFLDEWTKFRNRKAFEKIQKQQEEEREKRRRDIAKATPPESKT